MLNFKTLVLFLSIFSSPAFANQTPEQSGYEQIPTGKDSCVLTFFHATIMIDSNYKIKANCDNSKLIYNLGEVPSCDERRNKMNCVDYAEHIANATSAMLKRGYRLQTCFSGYLEPIRCVFVSTN